MPEKVEEVTSFKTRTHHGSGQKERYDLKACVYLEDARARDERGPDTPRVMKLSILRWDSPEGHPLSRTDRWSGGGDEYSHPRDRESSQIGSAAGTGDAAHVEHLEKEEAEGSADGSCSELDQFPGGPERAMREELWMLCNLDKTLLFSQFRLPAPPDQGSSAAYDASTVPSAPSTHVKTANGQTTTKSRRVPAVAGSQLPASSVVSLGSAGARDGGTPLLSSIYRGSDKAKDAIQGSTHVSRMQPQARQPQPPPQPTPVKRSRRDERVSFHARPTCHDYLGGWARGRAGAGVDPTDLLDCIPAPEGEGSGTIGTVDTSLPASNPLRDVGTSGRGSRRSADGSSSGKVRGGGMGNGRREVGEATTKTTATTASAAGTTTEGKEEKRVCRAVAVGFASGECAVLNATVKSSPSLISVLNRAGVFCKGRVTAVRFVPRAGLRLLVAAFSTGDVYTLDFALDMEAPLGPAAERAAASGGNTTSTGSGGVGSTNGGGSMGSSAGPTGADGTGSSKSSGRRGSYSRGGSSAPSQSRGSKDSGGVGANGKQSSPTLPTSSVSSSSTNGAAGSTGVNGRGGGGHDRGFFVERNSVARANPVSRWRVTSDGREITEMAFAPCEVDGRRLLALAALDGALRVIDYDEQALVAGYRSWFGGILCLDWSPDGRYIVTGGEDDAVTLWCLETRTCVLRGEGHGSWVTGVVFDTWTCRQPYYRFTSVGEDARLCIRAIFGKQPRVQIANLLTYIQRLFVIVLGQWEHDELAGSLLHGARAGHLRRVPPSGLQQRYKSSERLAEKENDHDNDKDADKRSAGGVNGGGGSLEAASSQTTLPTSVVVASPASSTQAPLHSVTTVETASKTAADTINIAGVGGAGGGRRPIGLPSRGVSFLAARGRREFSGRRGRHSANGGNMLTVPGVVVEEEDVTCNGGDVDVIAPPLQRKDVAKAEPLCCKMLAQQPLNQVAMVRGGVVTLCAEGLLKMWARPNVPPPLPPLGVDMQHRHPAFYASRGKDDDRAFVSAMDDHREEVDSASPPIKSSRRGQVSRTGTASFPPSSGAAADGGNASSSVTGTPSVFTSGSANSTYNGDVAKGKSSNGSMPTPGLDALINTEIHTPRGDGSSDGGDIAAANGGGAVGVKKKGFKRFFVGAEKSANGRSGSNSGATATARSDDASSSAFLNANLKAREPTEVRGPNQHHTSPSSSSGAASRGGQHDAHGSYGTAPPGVGKNGASTKRATGISVVSSTANRSGRSSHTSSGVRGSRSLPSASGIGSVSQKTRQSVFPGRGSRAWSPEVGPVP